MSEPHYIWWGYVKRIVQRHADVMKRVRAWDKTLTKEELKGAIVVEWAEAKTAVERTEGRERLELLRAAYWDSGNRNLEEAAQEMGIDWSTAKRWHKEFVLMVASALGLAD